MGYFLLVFPLALVIGLIGFAILSRLKGSPPPPPARPEQFGALATKGFSSPGALEQLHASRRHSAKVTTPAARPASPKGRRRTRTDIQADMRGRRDVLAACLDLLDEAASEHPSGHTKLAARYILRSEVGDRIELLFERNEKAKPKLWVTREHAFNFTEMGIKSRAYPAADLYKPTEAGGKPAYGRHLALKSMRDLANADLVRFTIDKVDQLKVILEKLAARV